MTTDRTITVASILARLQSFARIWGNDSTRHQLEAVRTFVVTLLLEVPDLGVDEAERLVDEAIREAQEKARAE